MEKSRIKPSNLVIGLGLAIASLTLPRYCAPISEPSPAMKQGMTYYNNNRPEELTKATSENQESYDSRTK